ncbi:MAG TPA: alpha/beta hydrolase [Pirellulales bacterium]|nr:alpha/beta hydrolase [Pirellulales bacterium]
MVFYALQTTLIFPGSWKQGTEGSRISQPPEGAKLVDLETAGAQPVKALFARALRADGTLWPETDRRPTILYFYGNGMQLAAALVQIEDMRRLGANVMVADYVGYGLSGGKPSEQGCYDTATAEYRWLVANPQVDGRKIISAGWSLGAAVAADLASRERVAGLMMFSAFTSMADAASWNYPWLPIRPLLKHRFESLAKISGVHCPILLAHGRQDTLVPFDMSERLAKAAGGPVEQVAIADGGHNDFWPSGHESVLAAMSRMVEKVAAE